MVALDTGNSSRKLGAGARSFASDHLEHLHPPGIGERFGNQRELLLGQA
jgi:hypothetical protein